MITKDGRDTPIERLTPENYIVPRGEEKDYHAVIEVEQYDPKTGKKISRPRLQKFGRKTFEQGVRASLQKQGYKVTILHDPTEWLKEHAAKRAQAQKDAAAAKAKAEQEKIDALVAAAVAKALADERVKQAEREHEIGQMLQKLQAEKDAAAEAERIAENKAISEAEKKKPGRPSKSEQKPEKTENESE